MVIGPVSALDPSWEGTAPLYSGFLRPRFDRADLHNSDPIEGLAGRFYFDVQKRGKKEFEPMPSLWVLPNKPLPSWAGTALANVERIRINFPFVWDELPTSKPNEPTQNATATEPMDAAGVAP
jgi:hypothetical protein